MRLLEKAHPASREVPEPHLEKQVHLWRWPIEGEPLAYLNPQCIRARRVLSNCLTYGALRMMYESKFLTVFSPCYRALQTRRALSVYTYLRACNSKLIEGWQAFR